MNNQVTMRFKRPRDLKANETADSLQHWMNQLEVYLKRDPTLSVFLEEDWDTTAANYRLEAKAGFTEDQMEANCNYYNHLIKERSTNMQSIYDILKEIYNIETNTTSFMSIAKVTKSKTESYAVFYAKIVYPCQQNLAPAGKTVQQIMIPATGDRLSVSLLDHAALLWLLFIDPRLPDRIDLDYAVQIREGARLSELVPQIAKAMPSILKRLDGVKTEVLACISELNLDEQEEPEETEEAGDSDSANIRFNRGGSRGFRGQRGRGGSQAPQRGFGRRQQSQPPQNRPLCRHCHWLKTFWKISEVDPYHKLENCQRYIPPSVKAIIEQEIEDTQRDIEEPSDQGMETQKSSPPPSNDLFQKAEADHDEDQPPPARAQEKRISKTKTMVEILKIPPLSESTAARLRIRAVRMIKKATSFSLI